MQHDRDFAACQGFLRAAKQFWMTRMYGQLRDEYRDLAGGRSVKDADDAAALMADNTTYACFSWLERHIQRSKYSGRLGLVPRFGAQPVGVPVNAPLALDPGLPVPPYYSAIDTHQHPGNLVAGPGAGRVYKESAASTQPGATSGYALHERFAQTLDRYGEFKSVLDLGCGFGKSALPIAARLPAARVIGVDLSGPCLELASVEALQAGLANLSYRQADARHLGESHGQFDLVTSTMVLHELDPPALKELLAETWRLLAPGGTCVHLDFQVRDPFLQFLYYGHSRRNNEPYMRAINEFDMRGELQALGFTDVMIEPFEEVPGSTAPEWAGWRFPWATFSARKPA
jgi:SAM-dependent methyltransferase